MRLQQYTLALSLVFAPHIAVGQVISGVVIAVSDGDTIRMLADDQAVKTLRLAGIDAPEKQQVFGLQARQQLTELCLEKQAQADVRTIDRYGRTVARVSCNQVDVASRMLELGLAWHFTRYTHTQPAQEAESDKAAQTRAMNGQIGLWGASGPVAPWDWRAKQRDSK